MQSEHTREPTGSPVHGVIPEPIRVVDGAPPVDPAPRRRNPAQMLLSALRGDKHMVGSRPPEARR
jgi:hypothetical protein